ncbi:MAG TPA: D-aminoacyl-tRNA deacylase [Opitutaceae bacterium]|nr:D-aminoacyl-tRNA deacylase [Opitutaceae bacterium]
MRAVIQRVSSARVTVAGKVTGEIGAGLLVLLGVAPGDTEADAQWLAEKIAALRIFEDGDGKMNLSLRDVIASHSEPKTQNPEPEQRPGLLVVSQFTLFASTRKGTRPSFNDAAKPDLAIPLYEAFNRFATGAIGSPVATGKFAAMMEVSLVNDGPVTLVIDSKVRE